MKNLIILLLLLNPLPCISQIQEDFFDSPDSVANLYLDLISMHLEGKYEQTIPELLAIKEHYQDIKYLDFDFYVSICNLLGHAYYYIGELNKAEKTYQEIIDLLKEDELDSPFYRQTLSDLGLLYLDLRNYVKADNFFNEALFLYEKNLDFGDKFVAALSNCSIVKHNIGEGLLAKMMIDWARELITNDDYQGKHIGLILSNMSLIYGQLGYNEDKLKMLLEAEKVIDEESPYNKITIYNNIAVEYLEKKDYNKALPYFEKAYKTNTNSLHRLLAGVHLAWTQYLNNDNKGYLTAVDLSQDIISDVISKFTYMSNEEREMFWENSNFELNFLNTLFVNSGKEKFNDFIYNNSLFSKGLLLKTSNLIKNEIYNSGDLESISLLNKKTELEILIEQNEIQGNTLKIVKDSINAYDKKLAEISSDYASFKEELTTSWSDIKKTLNSEEVAIEFVELPIVENDTVSFNNYYYALVIKDNLNHPKLIPLCSAQEFGELLVKKPSAKLDVFITGLYSSDNNDQTLGNRLYNIIWDPIEKELKGIKTVYYSPIGQLNSISFNSLSQNSIYLSERYDLHLLSSTSEVIKIKQKKESMINDAIVYGGIKYDTGTEEMIAEARGYKNEHHLTRSIENDSTRSGWSYLEGTAREASNIATILNQANIQSQIITENRANEESFKALDNASPSLLHIATHGFFLSDPIQLELNPFMQKKKAKHYSNLLLRSGLLFAGANKAWLGEDVVEGIDDGILTAEEISKLNLSKTKMVVLSACETGLGEIESTEGVFGLQRAFKLAGVQTLIMSLWKVPDIATSKLMIEFYNNWTGGMEIHQAFQKAQQAIKKEYSSPYYWAGFVMLD